MTAQLAACGWELFPHDADVGLRGFGPTREAAFEQAALALTAALTDPEAVRPREKVVIACAAPDDELLLVDWRGLGRAGRGGAPCAGHRSQRRDLYRASRRPAGRWPLDRPMRRRCLAVNNRTEDPAHGSR